MRQRFKIRKPKRNFELQLTSMMDMLIILVVFLLKSYSASTVNLSSSSNIKLPETSSAELPSDSSNLVIAPEGITFDNEKIVEFSNTETYELDSKILSDGGRRILPLFDAMTKTREKAQTLISKAVWKDQEGKTTVPPKFQGVVIIQADKALRYEVLRKVMYTAGAAQFKVFKFAAIQKEIGQF